MWECLFIFHSWRRVFLDKEFVIDCSFLSALENIVPFPSDLRGFRWIKLNWYFPIGTLLFISGCFQDFSLYLILRNLWYVLVRIPLCLTCLEFISFFDSVDSKCGMLLVIISSNSLSVCSLSLFLGTPKDRIGRSFLIVPQVSEALLIFFFQITFSVLWLDRFFCSSSSSLFLFSVIPLYSWAHPLGFLFLLLHFSILFSHFF